MRRLCMVLVALALPLLSACGGGGPSDPTAREITDEQLSLMVLPLSDLGSQYADFELDEEESGFHSNEQAVEDALDKEDEARDVEQFGQVNSYEEQYLSSGAFLEGEGPALIGTQVYLHEEADGASGDLRDSVEDAKRQVGKSKEGVAFESLEEFDAADIADESAAYNFRAATTSGDENATFHGTAVGFRRGRIIGGAIILRLDDQDVREEVTAIARKLDERILAVLRGEVEQPASAPTSQARPAPTSEPTSAPTSEPTSAPSAAVSPSDVLDSFRFSSEMAVEVDGGLTLTMEGEFEAPDRLGCTISGSLSGTKVGEDNLVVIGEDAWVDTGTGFQATSADDSAVVNDLDLCPGSPRFWAGFDFLQDPSSIPGQPDTMNGVDATRYALGEAAAALKSIGFLPAELEGMTINTFDVWVAEDGGWPVALDMDITADAQAAAETFGIPAGEAGQQARITMRVDITDVNAGDIHVAPPTP